MHNDSIKNIIFIATYITWTFRFILFTKTFNLTPQIFLNNLPELTKIHAWNYSSGILTE